MDSSSCGRELLRTQTECLYCEQKHDAKKEFSRICPKCNSTISQSDQFCTVCGHKLVLEVKNADEIDKYTLIKSPDSLIRLSLGLIALIVIVIVSKSWTIKIALFFAFVIFVLILIARKKYKHKL